MTTLCLQPDGTIAANADGTLAAMTQFAFEACCCSACYRVTGQAATASWWDGIGSPTEHEDPPPMRWPNVFRSRTVNGRERFECAYSDVYGVSYASGFDWESEEAYIYHFGAVILPPQDTASGKWELQFWGCDIRAAEGSGDPCDSETTLLWRGTTDDSVPASTFVYVEGLESSPISITVEQVGCCIHDPVEWCHIEAYEDGDLSACDECSDYSTGTAWAGEFSLTSEANSIWTGAQSAYFGNPDYIDGKRFENVAIPTNITRSTDVNGTGRCGLVMSIYCYASGTPTLIWQGYKYGDGPYGTYTRTDGCDLTSALTIVSGINS